MTRHRRDGGTSTNCPTQTCLHLKCVITFPPFDRLSLLAQYPSRLATNATNVHRLAASWDKVYVCRSTEREDRPGPVRCLRQSTTFDLFSFFITSRFSTLPVCRWALRKQQKQEHKLPAAVSARSSCHLVSTLLCERFLTLECRGRFPFGKLFQAASRIS